MRRAGCLWHKIAVIATPRNSPHGGEACLVDQTASLGESLHHLASLQAVETDTAVTTPSHQQIILVPDSTTLIARDTIIFR